MENGIKNTASRLGAVALIALFVLALSGCTFMQGSGSQQAGKPVSYLTVDQISPKLSDSYYPAPPPAPAPAPTQREVGVQKLQGDLKDLREAVEVGKASQSVNLDYFVSSSLD